MILHTSQRINSQHIKEKLLLSKHTWGVSWKYIIFWCWPTAGASYSKAKLAQGISYLDCFSTSTGASVLTWLHECSLYDSLNSTVNYGSSKSEVFIRIFVADMRQVCLTYILLSATHFTILGWISFCFFPCLYGLELQCWGQTTGRQWLAWQWIQAEKRWKEKRSTSSNTAHL